MSGTANGQPGLHAAPANEKRGSSAILAIIGFFLFFAASAIGLLTPVLLAPRGLDGSRQLVLIIVLSAALAITLWLIRVLGTTLAARPWRALVMSAALCGPLALVNLGAQWVSPTYWVCVVAWALCGMGMAGQVAVWGSLLSVFSADYVLPHLAGAAIGIAVVSVLLQFVHESQVALTFLLLLFLGSLVFARLVLNGWQPADVPASDAPYLGFPLPLSINVASHGFAYGLFATHLPHLGNAGIRAVLLGVVVGAGIFWIQYARDPRMEVDLNIERQRALPVLIAVLVSMPQFPGLGEIIGCGVAAVVFAHYEIANWSWITHTGHELGLSPARHTAGAKTGQWMGITVGLLVGWIVGNADCISGLCTELSILFTSTVVAVSLITDRLHPPTTIAEITGVDESDTPQVLTPAKRARVTRMAEEAELTEREAEVLLLMAEGRSISAIAGVLYVSESTVRTHAFHAYRKLSLGSLGQLQALLRDS